MEDAKTKLLQPEAEKPDGDVPEVYRSLNFRSLQDPYSQNRDTMASRYSTLRADTLESMLNGGLERFYHKYDHLSRKVNIQLPTPEVRFENLSFTVQVPASVEDHGTVGSHLRGIFTPWKRPAMVTKHALHPMSGIIKPGSLTLILANPGAGKSTFLKALAGKLQTSSKTKVGGEILYSGLRGDEIDLIKLAGMVDQTDNHIATLTVRETFKFADMCVNGLPEDQPEEMRDIAALRTELFIQILGMEECADTVVGDALLRGVSGGERKRVTIGEVLVGGQSLFLCDEISTGLDSAATFDIIKSLRTSTIANVMSARHHHLELLNTLNSIMGRLSISEKLSAEIRRFYNHLFTGRTVAYESQLLSHLPDHLCYQISSLLHAKAVRSVSLFESASSNK